LEDEVEMKKMERNIAKLVDLDKEEIDSKPNEH